MYRAWDLHLIWNRAAFVSMIYCAIECKRVVKPQKRLYSCCSLVIPKVTLSRIIAQHQRDTRCDCVLRRVANVSACPKRALKSSCWNNFHKSRAGLHSIGINLKYDMIVSYDMVWHCVDKLSFQTDSFNTQLCRPLRQLCWMHLHELMLCLQNQAFAILYIVSVDSVQISMVQG